MLLLSSLASCLIFAFASPRATRAQGRFALHVASKALEYYAETVFKVPYPLRKSDLLAIPGEAAISPVLLGLLPCMYACRDGSDKYASPLCAACVECNQHNPRLTVSASSC